MGNHIGENSEILICPSDRMSREEAEEQLYKDVKRTDTGQRITVTDPAFLTAVDQLTGSYEMAVLGVILILGGVWFLIHNILEISMIGDIRQFGLLYTIGTTKSSCGNLPQADGRLYACGKWTRSGVFSASFILWYSRSAGAGISAGIWWHKRIFRIST